MILVLLYTALQLCGITLLAPLFGLTADENLCQCQYKAPGSIHKTFRDHLTKVYGRSSTFFVGSADFPKCPQCQGGACVLKMLFSSHVLGFLRRRWRELQYIPRNMHTVFALLCFVVVIHWLIFPYLSGLLHWHCGNLTIAPVPAKQPWWIWINTSCKFVMNDCITTTKQSTTKPCAYFLGYTVLECNKMPSKMSYAVRTALLRAYMGFYWNWSHQKTVLFYVSWREREFSLSVQASGGLDQVIWLLCRCPHGPRTLSSNWISLNTSIPIAQTDTWPSPPPSCSLWQHCYVQHYLRIQWPTSS